MNQIIASAIVLARTNYGEADRIVTFITPDNGKLRVLAKGVRRIKSKLAGGIELFSISTINYRSGRGELGSLMSARLDNHYGEIAQDVRRTMLGYDLIKLLNKNTEDQPEAGYFGLLSETFAALDDLEVAPELVRLWFIVRLLDLAGHAPNLKSNAAGQALLPKDKFDFSLDSMCFAPKDHGQFTAQHIKLLRLIASGASPQNLNQVQGGAILVKALAPLATTMLQTHLRV